jgi:Proteins containing SET domain
LYREIIDKYCYRDRYGQYILCWDHGRYVNHSYRSNCISTAYNYELAIRDIQEGEELTDDYGYLNLNEPFAAFPERYSKRRMVYPDDLLHFHRKWDKQLKESYPFLPEVDQPLKAVLTMAEWERACRIAKGEEEMSSIIQLYYKAG